MLEPVKRIYFWQWFADIIDGGNGGIDIVNGHLGNDIYRYTGGNLNIGDFKIITDDSDIFNVKENIWMVVLIR